MSCVVLMPSRASQPGASRPLEGVSAGCLLWPCRLRDGKPEPTTHKIQHHPLTNSYVDILILHLCLLHLFGFFYNNMCLCVCVGLRRQLWTIRISCLQLQGWTAASKAPNVICSNSPATPAAPNTPATVIHFNSVQSS